MFDVKNEVLVAHKRIRNHVKETPLQYSIALSRKSRANVFLKCENLQYTCSFKVRGAMNKLLSLSLSHFKKGVVTASSGNHGAAIAFGLNKLQMNGIIFVPENASPAKVNNICNYTNNIKFYGLDALHTETHAINYAQKNNMLYISPYNDKEIIGGQGTIGLELLNQIDEIDAIFVSIGGGGLISGIAGYLKSMNHKIKVIGCAPENSPVMQESIKAGRIIEMPILPTLSDATAGGIQPGAITFDICKQFVDEYISVSEEQIKNAIIAVIKSEHYLIEGAAGVALAAFLKSSNRYLHKNVVIVLSGANISFETLKSITS